MQSIFRLLEIPEMELQTQYPITQLTSVMEAALLRIPFGNREYEKTLRSLSIRIAKAYPDDGKALVSRIDEFVNTPKNIVYFISQLANFKEDISEAFTIRELRDIMKANGEILIAEHENGQLRADLRALANKIAQEFRLAKAQVFAAAIRAFVDKMEGIQAAKADGPLVKDKPISLVKAGCTSAKEAVDYAIENKLLVVDLSPYQDLIDVDLVKLCRSCPNIQYLLIKSDQVTSLPPLAHLKALNINDCANIATLPDLPSLVLLSSNNSGLLAIPPLENLRFLYCSDCSNLRFIAPQPKLERLSCSDFVTLQQPVTATSLNGEDFNFIN